MIKNNIKISNGKTIKLKPKLLIINKLIDIDVIKTKELAKLSMNASFSPFFLAKKVRYSIIDP